jgi:hypothetical protein
MVRDFKRFDLVYTPYGAGIGEKTNGKYCEYADAEANEKQHLAKLDALIAEFKDCLGFSKTDGGDPAYWQDRFEAILAKYEAKS